MWICFRIWRVSKNFCHICRFANNDNDNNIDPNKKEPTFLCPVVINVINVSSWSQTISRVVLNDKLKTDPSWRHRHVFAASYKLWIRHMATNGNWISYQNIISFLCSGRTGGTTITFWELWRREVSYGSTPYMSCNIKISCNWPFFVSAPRNNVGGRRSDNFEANSSFWSLLPILFREHIEMGNTFKIGGI